ncbi:MAG TPA: hypothetical protein VEL76_33675, partial [Gemmataceae bacterium]|nr:hypothetical protein [Gemmataceae bacterium]
EIWWEPCRQHHRPVWTDDYSNLLSVLTLGTDDYWILGIALLVGILLPFAVAGAEAGVIARRRQKAKLAAG